MRTTVQQREELLFIPRGPHRLAAVLHRAARRRAPLVVLAHGFTGNKSENGRLFVSTARALAAAGLDALRFDFMGSGDSSGEFAAMSPASEIADLHAVLDWARRRGWRRAGLLGLSMGGAVAICAAAERPVGEIAAVCTWSSVPSFAFWMRHRAPAARQPDQPGSAFARGLPATDVPAACAQLVCPKLQIQGDRDLPGFRAGFAANLRAAPPPKRHVVLRGADHVFTHPRHRARVIRLTTKFFQQHLFPS
ncbi:MAG: alpha/beta hydrolase [Candidatus Didemnitutus sp.]|nr:alpha/beta hydrolase [Candidatus Didemnitutus sp.]